MIKYSEIKGYKNIGECGFGSHLYQWIEDAAPGNLKVILVRAFDIEARIWSGYVMQRTKEITNLPDVVIESDCPIIKEAKRYTDFFEFLEGNSYYDDFKSEFKVVGNADV